MCYFLYIASPLTLSEVRSMVPDGITVDLADPVEQQILKSSSRGVQTVARLLVGRCSCDFVRQRHADPREDERHLRERFRQRGIGRDLTISGLERHRAGAKVPVPAQGWPRALVDFVHEHARNAGRTVYQLAFLPPSSALRHETPLREVKLSRVTPELESWLDEGPPVAITR
ncbi:MAG TPA: hypothetical protein VFX42_02215 [Gemmatimonadales bacterium]|nr:hypothetical protein [Gemmatimonadales bacterium]